MPSDVETIFLVDDAEQQKIIDLVESCKIRLRPLFHEIRNVDESGDISSNYILALPGENRVYSFTNLKSFRRFLRHIIFHSHTNQIG